MREEGREEQRRGEERRREEERKGRSQEERRGREGEKEERREKGLNYCSSKGISSHDVCKKLNGILSNITALILRPTEHQRQNCLETRQWNGLKTHRIRTQTCMYVFLTLVP